MAKKLCIDEIIQNISEDILADTFAEYMFQKGEHIIQKRMKEAENEFYSISNTQDTTLDDYLAREYDKIIDKLENDDFIKEEAEKFLQMFEKGDEE